MDGRADDRGRRERSDALFGVTAACIAAAAGLLIGGAHAATQVALSTALLLLAAAFVMTRGARGFRVVPFCALFAAFVALDLLQLVPLPAPLVHLLSPLAYETRSAVTDRRLMPLTLDVTATALAMARAFACLGIFVVVAGVSRSRRVATRILMVLALYGAVEAIIALVQRATNATAILGLYVPRSMSGLGVFGTFVDSNHTASVLTIGAMAAIGMALQTSGARRALLIGCAVVATGVTVATGSRGGVLGLAAGGFLIGVVHLVRRKGILQGTVMALATLALFAATVLWSSDALRARMLTGSSRQLVENQKTRGWLDGLRMAVDYRWTGVGRGALEAPLRAYRSDDEEVRLVYVENFVVQSAAEWGLVATAALFVAAALAMRRTLRHDDVLDPPTIGALAAVVAVVVHELMDFGTELPGVALPATVALGVLVGTAVRREEGARRVRPAWSVPVGAAWVAALLLAGWASSRTLDADDDRLHDAVTAKRATAPMLAAAIARHPADDYLELLAAEEAMARRDPSAMRYVNRAMLLHPTSWRGHLLAAHLLVALGRRPQAAIEYGLAERYGLLLEDRKLVALLGTDVVETVERKPAALLALADRMIVIGRLPEAEAAWARALELSDAREPVLEAELRAAGATHDAKVIGRHAAALLHEATSVGSFLAVAQALADTGEPAKASEVVDRAVKLHPADATLIIGGARLKLAAGQPEAAKALLLGSDHRAFTLEQRRDTQQLLATIADRGGDVEGAVIARARAQLLERQIREIRSDNPRARGQ